MIVLKVAALALVVAIAVVLGLAAMKSDNFHVERSATIDAPAERIFAMIEDFHSWGAWSPYEKKDPQMKRTFSGADRGKGAVYAWDGSSEVGQGRMEIVEAPAPTKVAIKLDFVKPFEAHNAAVFTLAPASGATRVTWAMDGPVPFPGKIIHVFFDMDRMVGTDFEAGLANLKAAAEKK
jgi:hypothetical protein